MPTLKKKTVAISGGLGSLGINLALKLSQSNFNVLIGDNNSKKYKLLKKKIKKHNIKFFKGNLCLENDINKFISFGINHFKKIDYSIHCCYPKNKGWNNSLEKLKQKTLNKNIVDHIGGSIIFSQKLIKHFLKNKEGKLIHVSSIQGISAPKFDHYKNLNMNSPIFYTAAKSAIISVTKYLAKYYGSRNIQINCISPGGIKNNQSKIFTKRYNKSCLTKGLLDVEDLHSAILFLLDEKSKYINGQNIIVDDGWSL